MAGRLRVPSQSFSGLAALLKMTDAQADELIQAIQSTPPAVLFGNYIDRVAEKVTNPDDAEDILLLLSGLYAAHADSDLSLEDFAKSVVQAMGETQREDLKAPNGDWSPFVERLIRLLNQDTTLGVASKAANIQIQGARIFHDSRILTDFRPIFQGDPAEPPTAGILLHNLKIEYLEGGHVKSFFVVLDEQDIETLKSTIERAEAKAVSLRRVLGHAPITLLQVD